MMYVEWLRNRRALIGVAIVLGVMLVAAVGMRIYALRWDTVDKIVARAQFDPGTKKQIETLPDGTKRLILDTPDGTHITVDDHGYYGKEITVIEPKGSHQDSIHGGFGPTTINTIDNGTRKEIVVKTAQATTFAPYLAVAWFFAIVVATFIGAGYARENDGHLEYALTKPASRTTLALAIFAVDALTIVATVAGTTIVLLMAQALFELPRINFAGAFHLWAIAILTPLGWCALLNAVTASLRRGYGAVLGLSWPVMLGIGGLSFVPWNDSMLGRTAALIIKALSALNPLNYTDIGGNVISVNNDALMGNTVHGAIGVLAAAALVIIYTALAVLQWRRVEA